MYLHLFVFGCYFRWLDALLNKSNFSFIPWLTRCSGNVYTYGACLARLPLMYYCQRFLFSSDIVCVKVSCIVEQREISHSLPRATIRIRAEFGASGLDRAFWLGAHCNNVRENCSEFGEFIRHRGTHNSCVDYQNSCYYSCERFLTA